MIIKMWDKMTITGGYNSSRDSSISIIRVLAFLSIIACHIMQYYHCEFAWWFNVGVQVFLCLSGYLYGRKAIDDELLFYKKQFIKILVPYYIVIAFAIIAQLLFVRNEISVAHIVKSILCYGTLSGGEHLWFVPTILFCYILTPFFDKLNNYIFKKKYSLLYCLITFVALSVVVKLYVPYFNSAWIACFYLSHVLGKNEVNNRINPKLCKIMIYISAMCLVSIQIVISNILSLKMTGIIDIFFNIMCDYGHTFLGVSIVLLLLDIFRGRMIPLFVMKPIAFLDFISYEGYLVHQFFILGAFSLLTIIAQPIIAIITIVIVTIICGLLIKLIANRVRQFIK